MSDDESTRQPSSSQAQVGRISGVSGGVINTPGGNLTQYIYHTPPPAGLNPDAQSSPQLKNDLIQPHLFDLRELISTVRNSLRTHPCGPLGLAIACDDASFYTQFCLRLKHVIGNNARIPPDAPLAIAPSTHGLEMAKRQLLACLGRPETKDIIVSVQTGSAADRYLSF